MDKNEFIDAVAKQKGISRGKAYRSVEAVMDTIRILIMQGEEIKIGGFGTFDVQSGQGIEEGCQYPW